MKPTRYVFNHDRLCALVARAVKAAFTIALPECRVERACATVIHREEGDWISVHLATNAVNNMTEDGIRAMCGVVGQVVFAMGHAADDLFSNCQVHEGGINFFFPTTV